MNSEGHINLIKDQINHLRFALRKLLDATKMGKHRDNCYCPYCMGERALEQTGGGEYYKEIPAIDEIRQDVTLLMEEKYIKQSAAAEEIGISRATLSQFLNGRLPTRTVVIKLLNWLGNSHFVSRRPKPSS